MTVAELVEQLQKMPQNAEIFVGVNTLASSIYNRVHQISSNEEYERNRDELMVWIEGVSL